MIWLIPYHLPDIIRQGRHAFSEQKVTYFNCNFQAQSKVTIVTMGVSESRIMAETVLSSCQVAENEGKTVLDESSLWKDKV